MADATLAQSPRAGVYEAACLDGVVDALRVEDEAVWVRGFEAPTRSSKRSMSDVRIFRRSSVPRWGGKSEAITNRPLLHSGPSCRDK